MNDEDPIDDWGQARRDAKLTVRALNAWAIKGLRDALNTLEFSTERNDEPMIIAKLIGALVQLAARGNTRAQIHEAIDTAWDTRK